jgi:serine/threonine-protein kinase
MRSLRPEVSEELEDIVMHCLAKNRDERFATVSELARALAPYGSSGSQLHVDRASRVLGVTEISASLPLSQDLTSSAERSGNHRAPHALSTTPLRASRPVPIRATVDSWGRTDAPGEGNAPPRRSRAPLFIGLGVGGLGLIAVLLLLGSREPNARASASASVAARPPLASALPVPVKEVIAAPEPQVIPAAAPPDSGAPSVLPQAAPQKPKLPAAAIRPALPKAAAAPRAAGSSDLTDFGGRR